MEKAGVQNIIFDLGGVIIGLDISRTLLRLAELLDMHFDEMSRIFYQDVRFKEYETGNLTDQQFRNFIRTLSSVTITDAAIDEAWNAMILDIPREQMNLLKMLRSDYSVYLLSNTNAIHLDYVKTKLPVDEADLFDEFFNKTYYSHLIGMRKPDNEIYEYVLKDRNMLGTETLFFDDNADNILGAQAVGIHTFHVKDLADVITYFHG
ncbi:HAD family phosphatase [Fulvivirga sp. M361]|uniref:HAD family hydrolase n=1 Tax=Fulvivirga sp. M361 TaxID=2594266 RepID=UPI00117BA145|nr:HAD family phosphatase [Fulvivirga sp. M361]TRX61694.1 HAD family phosphatase [Fulvivirga sp. M361]